MEDATQGKRQQRGGEALFPPFYSFKKFDKDPMLLGTMNAYLLNFLSSDVSIRKQKLFKGFYFIFFSLF